MTCPKCNGLTVTEDGFAWRCVLCGKRGHPIDSREIVLSYQRFQARVRKEEDQNWLAFWKRRRLRRA